MASGQTTRHATPDGWRQAISRFESVRSQTRRLAARLSPEDACVQSMTDASPAKWHLAHTSWFFERFVLAEAERDFAPFDDRFEFLFNSYYNAIGDRQPRNRRGMLTRPSLEHVLAYRDAVEQRVIALNQSLDEDARAPLGPILEIGLQHEQQHQELLLTDIKHLLWCNPLRPAFREGSLAAPVPVQDRWHRFDGGLIEIGHDQPAFPAGSFAFDNELPVHRVWLEPFEIASRPITNEQFLAFVQDGGYQRSEYWLDEGWARVQSEQWACPMYWLNRDGRWLEFTLAGEHPLDAARPACGLSFFEVDAYARWAGARLPTEAEWEHAATGIQIAGNTLESDVLHPTGSAAADPELPAGLYGDVWEWTGSQYRPYPGYAPPAGAIGEYNGKFMSSQFVLRGGSCASPRDHLRVTYRNFFSPHARWQFSGARLARDL